MANIEPVVPNLLAATQALQNKYAPGSQYAQPSQILQALAALPAPRAATMANTIQPLAAYDMARANRGLAPLGPRQSAAALRALTTGKPATPPRRQGLLESAISDLRSLVTSIPHLPMGLVHEVQALPSAIQDLPTALAEGSNPIEALGNVANLPGFRMIPGSFVAGAFGDEGGGVQQLLAHPLYTALDVLPIASGAAKTTRVARAAAEGYAKQVEALTQARIAEGFPAGTARIPAKPRALQTALTRSLTPEGQIVPNRLGRGIGAIAEDLKATNIGHGLYTAFGERNVSRTVNQMGQFLGEAINPRIKREALQPPIPGGLEAIRQEMDIVDLGKDINDRLTQHVGKPLSPEVVEFTNRARYSETPDGTPIAPEQMPDWTPEQRALARDIRDHTYKTANYTDALPGAQSTKSVNVDDIRETYDYRTAKVISSAQAAESSAREILEARQAALATPANPSPLSPVEIDTRLTDVQRRIAEIPKGGKGRKELQRLETLYQQAKDGIGRPDVARVIPVLEPLRQEYFRTIPRLIEDLKAERWADANKGLRQLADTRHGRTLPFDLDGLRTEVSRLVKRDKALARTSHVNERFVEREAARRARVEARFNPARFDPLVKRVARQATAERIRTVFAHDPDLDTLLRLADEGLYDKLITKDARFRRWVRQDQVAARESWKALRDAGHDPIFFSNVSPSQAFRQARPRMSDRPVSLEATHARMMDARPYIDDAGIIVTQAGLDLLTRRGTEAALNDLGATFGRTRADIMAEIEERVLAGPPGTARVRAAQLFDRKYRAWNPGQYLGAKTSGAFGVEGADQLYVPRAMAENLQRMYEPPLPKLTAAFDPILNVFRTSVLPLALRWQLNNAIGGMIVTAVSDPAAFLELPGVLRDMIAERRQGLPAASERVHIAGAPPPGIGSMTPDMLRWQAENKAKGPLRERIGNVTAAARWGSGRKAEELYTAARNDRISKITDPAKRALEMSYGANQFLDDMFRSIVGRSSTKRALRKGFTPDAADAIAVQSIRRVFQAWDEMTPMERSVMRSIMPFYGFASYAVKFVLRYPFDHPLRVSVLSSIAQAELEDAMTGLPEYIREMIMLGDPRANGHVRALNISPFNPFGGVPDMFTRAGFLGQLNPVITAALESIGVDVRQGGPQLYPELKYDPVSGRLMVDPGGNFVSNLIGNVAPQAMGIMSLLGRNDQFNETLQRDPAAAGRMLMGNFGLPVLFRDINVGDQLIKAEMARFEDQDNARREALKTGNLGILDAFPGLAAYGDQIRQLEESGQLDQLRPTEDQPGAPSTAGRAYALQAAALGG